MFPIRPTPSDYPMHKHPSLSISSQILVFHISDYYDPKSCEMGYHFHFDLFSFDFVFIANLFNFLGKI